MRCTQIGLVRPGKRVYPFSMIHSRALLAQVILETNWPCPLPPRHARESHSIDQKLYATIITNSKLYPYIINYLPFCSERHELQKTYSRKGKMEYRVNRLSLAYSTCEMKTSWWTHIAERVLWEFHLHLFFSKKKCKNFIKNGMVDGRRMRSPLALSGDNCGRRAPERVHGHSNSNSCVPGFKV